MLTSEEEAVKKNLQVVKDAYQYLQSKSYPTGSSEGRKRCIRRKAAEFVMREVSSMGQVTIILTFCR